ncbi:MAG: thiol-activated cytolysin family protein [Armatimonadetes bacterium]|nr:thiol-activated cytolysin family protein [Armatimonadota bacterium]
MKCTNRATATATVLSALTLFALCAPPVAAQSDKSKVIKGKPPVLGPIIDITKPREIPSTLFNPLMMATSLDDYFNKLPNWSPAGNGSGAGKKKRRQDGETNVGGEQQGIEREGNRDYNVTRQKKSLTETPGDIVSFDPSASVFYPGALLQETGMRQGLGSLQAIPGLEGKRAPLKVVLNIGGQTTVADPDFGNIATAVGQLRSGLNGKPMATSTNFDYSVAASAEQSAMHLGISAKYLTASAKAVLDTKHRLDQESINGTFVVKAYTISAQPLAAGWRGFFSDKFTLGDAKALAKAKAVSPGNQPCYVDSITYGTMVVFNMTRTLSEEEIRAKAEAKGSIGFASGSVDFAGEQMKKSNNTTVRFTTIGGAYPNASGAVRTVGAGEFNSTMAALVAQAPQSTELVPISYTVRALKDRSLAAVQSTAEYTTTIAAPNPAGEKLRLRISFQILDAGDGAMNNNVECWATVRMDNRQVGGIDRGQPVTKEKNQTVDLGDIPLEVFYGNTNRKMDIRLYDRDGGSQDDRMGNWSLNIDPVQLVNAPLVQNGYEIKDGKKRLKSKLTIAVERAGYL